MTNKPVCSHVLASSAWTLKQAHNYRHMPGNQITIICMQGKFLTN